MHPPQERHLQPRQEVCVCVFFHSENENQGNDKRHTRKEPFFKETDKIQVKKFRISKKDEATAQVRDKNPTGEVECPGEPNEEKS